jgi:Fe2+ or Zn2+ uptake regulation protein
LTVGQKIDVLCIGVDTVQGSIKLSRKWLSTELHADPTSTSSINGGDDDFFASGEDKLSFDMDNEPKVEDTSSKLPKTQSNANAAHKTPPAPEQDDLSKLTRDDLKEKLRERGLKVSGMKVELIERLCDDDFFASGEDKLAFDIDNEPKVEDASSKLPKTQSNANAAAKTPLAPEQGDLSKLTRDDLKEILRERGLKVKGLKVELIERLQESEQCDLSKLTKDDLKEKLRERGLKVSGIKVELIERLQESG